MNLPDLLFECADALERGDALLPKALLPILESARDQLDEWGARLEANPHPPGLEGLDDSFAEAIDGFFEALDLLELAVVEGVPELATSIKGQTQDAVDILRDIGDQANSHYQMLSEELAERG
jgi:hypothetical protein